MHYGTGICSRNELSEAILCHDPHRSSAKGTTDPSAGEVPTKCPSISRTRACLGPSQSMSTQSCMDIGWYRCIVHVCVSVCVCVQGCMGDD